MKVAMEVFQNCKGMHACCVSFPASARQKGLLYPTFTVSWSMMILVD